MNDILLKAITTYGVEFQEQVAIEECAELIKAICNKHRGRSHNIAEEIADVEIMLAQLKIINQCKNAVEGIKVAKLKRLQERLDQND